MEFVKKDGGVVGKCKVAGLIDATFNYEMKKENAASLQYEGPTIPPQVWHEILAFFRWTYDTYKSESQVRLYVNPAAGTWRAWAFPQEEDTGMSAREIKQEEKPEEAKERFATWGFPLSGDWFYFGTVHHHCSMSAFQSSTDEQNEKGQDGLHITVGNIDKDHHDLHCRLYVGGVLFTCNMSSFWDIGEHLRDLLPKDLWDRVARHQMGYHNKESAFPERWKQNVTKLKRTYTSQTPTTYVGGYQSGPLTYGYSWLERIEKVISGVVAEAFDNNVGWEELDQMFQDLGSDPVYAAFMTLMEKYNVDYSDVERKWPKSEDEATKLAAQELTARAQAEAEGRKRGRKGKKGDKAEANGNGQITDVSAQASVEQEELDDWAKYTGQVYGED